MSFHELRRDSLLYYQSDRLQSRHGFSTRYGGVSTGFLASLNLGVNRGDNAACVNENYRRFGQAIGFDPAHAVLSKQVHRDDIRIVTREDWGAGLLRPNGYEADGLITNVPDTALMVFSADCGTVLLEDPVTGAVGACHAGWRGTALGIAEKTAREMIRVYGCRAEDLRAALGPCISLCCFETDANVPDAMRAALGRDAEPGITFNGSKYHVDMKYMNRVFLLRAGLREEQIDASPLCTACDPETFWSYRRAGDDRGSLAAVIVAGGDAG